MKGGKAKTVFSFRYPISKTFGAGRGTTPSNAQNQRKPGGFKPALTPFRRGRLANCRQEAVLACRSQYANGLTLLPCYLAVSGKAPNCAGLARKKSDCCCQLLSKSAQSFLKHLAGANQPLAFTRWLPLCHQRHRSCTDYDLGNNRVKGGFEVNAEKILLQQLQVQNPISPKWF